MPLFAIVTRGAAAAMVGAVAAGAVVGVVIERMTHVSKTAEEKARGFAGRASEAWRKDDGQEEKVD